MAMHLVPPGARPANPLPMRNVRPPRQPRGELTYIPTGTQTMDWPDEEREAGGWPEHLIDQRCICAIAQTARPDDEEDGDGY